MKQTATQVEFSRSAYERRYGHQPNEAPTRRRAWPVREACHQLGIGRTSLYELAARGELKLLKITGRTLVPDSEIERLTSISEAA